MTVPDPNLPGFLLDLDLRLMPLWEVIEKTSESHSFTSKETIAAFSHVLRCAYEQGYGDAMREDSSGKLYTDNGYAITRGRPSEKT